MATAINDYLGPFCRDIECLIIANDRLNAAVVERINETQELVMLNNYAIENTDFQMNNNSFHSRATEVETWRYVLNDLNKRLKIAKDYLEHEHKALCVVVQRIDREIKENIQHGTRPGALEPFSDTVEIAIFKELRFLKKQQKKFEDLIIKVENDIKEINNTRKHIENQILNKETTIQDEEKPSKGDWHASQTKKRIGKDKNKLITYERWKNRCIMLKETGLKELSKTVITRQELRGARTELSIKSQGHATQVDAVLRRRLHTNQTRLQELAWQRDEAARDHKILEDELFTTQNSILKNMEQERMIEMRLEARKYKMPLQRFGDVADGKIKQELVRLRRLVDDLRENIKRIRALQQALLTVICNIDCAGQEINQVIALDEERIRKRTAAADSVKTKHSTDEQQILQIDDSRALSKYSLGRQALNREGNKSKKTRATDPDPPQLTSTMLATIPEEYAKSDSEDSEDRYPLAY